MIIGQNIKEKIFFKKALAENYFSNLQGKTQLSVKVCLEKLPEEWLIHLAWSLSIEESAEILLALEQTTEDLQNKKLSGRKKSHLLALKKVYQGSLIEDLLKKADREKVLARIFYIQCMQNCWGEN